MAIRDPEKTARNKLISTLTGELKSMLEEVLLDTKATNELSLHAYFATRKAKYIDLKHQVIASPEQYISIFVKGLKSDLLDEGFTLYAQFYENLIQSDVAKKYLYVFLKRTFFREYENITKCRPNVDEAAYWIGQNNADYGLLVSPRYRKGQWENDVSEIRRFRKRYWSIGHVIETGLVIPDRNEIRSFENVEQYLQFFRDIVRQTGSKYQRDLADLYSEYVIASDEPEKILLLFTELRFQKERKHKYRLDFCVIDVESGNKIGFEISPWSSHGHIPSTKTKSQKEINAEAAENFEKEMKKHKDYFLEHGIFTLIFTDTDLKNIQAVFDKIEKYLKPNKLDRQLELQIIAEFFD